MARRQPDDGSHTADGGSHLTLWIERMAQDSEHARRRRSGIRGPIALFEQRVRTVARIRRDMGTVATAGLLIEEVMKKVRR